MHTHEALRPCLEDEPIAPLRLSYVALSVDGHCWDALKVAERTSYWNVTSCVVDLKGKTPRLRCASLPVAEVDEGEEAVERVCEKTE